MIEIAIALTVVLGIGALGVWMSRKWPGEEYDRRVYEANLRELAKQISPHLVENRTYIHPELQRHHRVLRRYPELKRRIGRDL